MKIRNLLSIKKLAVLGICVSFLAGGCGKMTESSIPELEEPVALNEAYRPVDNGTMGGSPIHKRVLKNKNLHCGQIGDKGRD